MSHKNFFLAAALGIIALPPAVIAQETEMHPVTGWNTTDKIPSTYYEDLMTNNIDIKPGHCWTVQVEANTENPGWYRFQPYLSLDDYVPKVLEETDDTYVYINATNPDKVYVEEFSPYGDSGEYDFVNLVPENGWTGERTYYGTLSDNVISFAPLSFAVYDASYDVWYQVSRNTGFKLVLNESEAKDYAVSVDVSTCTSFEEIAYYADCGSDVWDVKAIVKAGMFKPEYYQEALTDGTVIDNIQYRQYESVSARGMYTVVVVGVDRKGNMVGCDYDFGFNVIDDDSKWLSLGTTEYTEDFVADRYLDVATATYDVELQKHNEIDGYFRLVNPYASHPSIKYPQYQSDHSHGHYIYINAGDISAPYIESAPIGVNNGGGDICITSAAGLEIASGKTISEVKAEGVPFGQIDGEGYLTFPSGSLLISEKKREKGDWRISAPGFKVKLPIVVSGVENILGDPTDSDSEKVLCNLQGIRVVDSESLHGIFLQRRSDGTFVKVVR